VKDDQQGGPPWTLWPGSSDVEENDWVVGTMAAYLADKCKWAIMGELTP
jgi:hypothetical protein